MPSKIFERDEKVLDQVKVPQATLDHIETDIQAAEEELDDDAESIITNERYIYIASILKGCYHKKNAGGRTISDKIDRVVTNRIAALAHLRGGHVHRFTMSPSPPWAAGPPTGPTTA